MLTNNIIQLPVWFRAFLNSFIVYAEPVTGVNTGGSIWVIFSWIIGLSSAIAIVGISICILKYMLSTDAQTAAEAKDTGKQVILAWVIINCLGALMTSIFSLVNTIEP